MRRDEHDLRLDYLELTVPALGPTKAFLAAAFGWRLTDYGPEYCAFHDGRLEGGLRLGTPLAGPEAPLAVLYALDLEDAQRRVEAAGGRIVQPIFAFPGGRRFHFEEPGGNQLAIWSDREPDAG